MAVTDDAIDHCRAQVGDRHRHHPSLPGSQCGRRRLERPRRVQPDRLAVTRRDSRGAGNRYLTVVLKAVREMQSDVVQLLTRDTGSIDRAVEQHRSIVDAVIEGSAEKAENAARVHIQTTAARCSARAAPPQS